MKEKIRKLWRGEEEAATCKICSTRLEVGELTCPNCGFLVGSESNVFEILEDKAGREKEKEVQEMLDPDLDDDGELEAGVGVEMDLDEEIEAAMEAQKKLESSTPVVSLGPSGLRELLAKQPEMLEPGLSIVTDKAGKPVGAGLSTAVGSIDLLARDASGGFVVVIVAERGQGEEIVGETLQRVGWVRKNLAKGKQRVRGIVLLDQVPENLSYAATAVADTILFKAYRVGVTFEDVEA